MTLIGLIGYAGSGKSTIADAIRGEDPDGRTYNLAFAKELKRRAADCLRIDERDIERRKATLRPLLVEIGRAGRMLDPAMWIKPVKSFIELAKAENEIELITVSDVRYTNECEYLLDAGAHLFYIHRDGVGPANDEERDSILDVSHHMSLHVIYNSTTPEAAAAEIMAIVKGTVKV